nr:unnamed protein product [Callosobruchus chinensis]
MAVTLKGRGRHFRVGDQRELTQYLATVCPLTGEKLETEEDRKFATDIEQSSTSPTAAETAVLCEWYMSLKGPK